MKLYHGSNVEVHYPIIKENLRALDFGAGFYLTSSRQQAERWAKTVTKRRNTEVAILNIYDIDEKKLDIMEILKFETANAEWLDFVVANRKEQILSNTYDVYQDLLYYLQKRDYISFDKILEDVPDGFANARTVRNLLEFAITNAVDVQAKGAASSTLSNAMTGTIPILEISSNTLFIILLLYLIK